METNGRRTPELQPTNKLAEFGWSYVSSVNRTRARNPQRMAEFDKVPEDEQEKMGRVVNLAYYALELSTDLPPYAQAVADFESLGEPGSSAEHDKIVDRFIVATGVHGQLWEAAETSRSFGFDDWMKIRQATVRYNPANTGCLKVIRSMAIANEKLGWVSDGLARNGEGLLRMVIGWEKGIDLFPSEQGPKSEESAHYD